jgi:hypothetical protein
MLKQSLIGWLKKSKLLAQKNNCKKRRWNKYRSKEKDNNSNSELNNKKCKEFLEKMKKRLDNRNEKQMNKLEQGSNNINKL